MKNTLKDEIYETVKWFADMDIVNYGYVTESTLEMAKVQNVTLPSSMPTAPAKMEISKKSN